MLTRKQFSEKNGMLQASGGQLINGQKCKGSRVMGDGMQQ